MKKLELITFLTFILISFSGKTQTSSLSCSKKGTVILYANGVNVIEANAWLALDRIKKLVPKNQLDEKSNVSYDLTYNYSLGLNLDILEVITQKLPKAFLQSNNYIDKYDAFYKFKNGLSKVALEFVDISAMEEIINDTNQVMLNHILDVRDQTVNEFTTIYNSYLNEGKKIVAISHSQGGLFVGDAYNATAYADKSKFFQSMQIATPADSIVNGGGYNTYYGDEVINNLRSSLGALPGNTSSTLLPWPFSLLDRPHHEYLTEEDKIDKYLNHGILSTYLADSNLRGAIVNKIKKVALNLENNCGKPPIASFSFNISPLNPFQVNFDGSSSSDPENKPLTYQWDFGDLTYGSGMNPIHTYFFPGTYTVSLKVFDEDGLESKVAFTKVVEVIGSLKCGGASGHYINGSVFVADTATVNTTGFVFGNVEVCGTAKVLGNASAMAVIGKIVIDGNAELNGDAQVTSMSSSNVPNFVSVHIGDNAVLKSMANIQTNLSGDINIIGNTIIEGLVNINTTGHIELSENVHLAEWSQLTIQYLFDNPASGNIIIKGNTVVNYQSQVLVNIVGGGNANLTIEGNSLVSGEGTVIEVEAANGYTANLLIRDVSVAGFGANFQVGGILVEAKTANANVNILGPLTICEGNMLVVQNTNQTITSYTCH